LWKNASRNGKAADDRRSKNNTMVTFRDFINGFRRLEIDRSLPVLVHTSMSAFGKVHGGPDVIVGALLANFSGLMMPTFTYKCMLTPEDGPADNGMLYGSAGDVNKMAEFFHPDLPADPLMGVVAETVRRNPEAHRSSHPLLSFAGIQVGTALNRQTLASPLAPIQALLEAGGWVLLLGVDHTVNTSIHLAEKLAGRKQFVRWALTPDGVTECPGFPGCSDGFQELAPRFEPLVRQVQIGQGLVQALPLAGMVEIAREWIAQDPQAFLCERSDCDRCQAVRHSLAAAGDPSSEN
jgi:aminoglycoside 3-N-acetyltransferase